MISQEMIWQIVQLGAAAAVGFFIKHVSAKPSPETSSTAPPSPRPSPISATDPAGLLEKLIDAILQKQTGQKEPATIPKASLPAVGLSSEVMEIIHRLLDERAPRTIMQNRPSVANSETVGV